MFTNQFWGRQNILFSFGHTWPYCKRVLLFSAAKMLCLIVAWSHVSTTKTGCPRSQKMLMMPPKLSIEKVLSLLNWCLFEDSNVLQGWMALCFSSKQPKDRSWSRCCSRGVCRNESNRTCFWQRFSEVEEGPKSSKTWANLFSLLHSITPKHPQLIKQEWICNSAFFGELLCFFNCGIENQ